MNGVFSCNSKIWFAERMTDKFTCKGDGETKDLQGNMLDWRVMNEEMTIEFPLPDHIFRFLFKPDNLYAENDLKRKFKMSMEMGEKQPLAATGPT